MNIDELRIVRDLIDILCEAESDVDVEGHRVITFSEGDARALHELQERVLMMIAQQGWVE